MDALFRILMDKNISYSNLAISVSHNNRLTMMLIEEHALCSVTQKKDARRSRAARTEPLGGGHDLMCGSVCVFGYAPRSDLSIR
jgi:hypothetical protein